jgi:hypothetical protein
MYTYYIRRSGYVQEAAEIERLWNENYAEDVEDEDEVADTKDEVDDTSDESNLNADADSSGR